jgi:hypothetical protein
VPPQYVDAELLVQIVKAVMEGMAGSATQTTPTTQIPQAAPYDWHDHRQRGATSATSQEYEGNGL